MNDSIFFCFSNTFDNINKFQKINVPQDAELNFLDIGINITILKTDKYNGIVANIKYKHMLELPTEVIQQYAKIIEMAILDINYDDYYKNLESIYGYLSKSYSEKCSFESNSLNLLPKKSEELNLFEKIDSTNIGWDE